MMSVRANQRVVRVVVVAAFLFAGIGFNGTFERGAHAQEPPPDGIVFMESGTPGLDTVFLRGVDTADPGGLLKIEVMANQVNDLYGVSFALQFPQNLFRFPKGRATAAVDGSFLSESGSVNTILVTKQAGNEIVVGLTRTGEEPGVSGSGLLVTLEFRGLGVAGKKRFRLRNRSAVTSSGGVAENYTWLAGKAVVTVSSSSP